MSQSDEPVRLISSFDLSLYKLGVITDKKGNRKKVKESRVKGIAEIIDLE